MATGGDSVESIPVSPGKEYHFCILYNYDSDPPEDIEKSLNVTKKIITTLASIGLRASYYYDRDCLPGLNVFEELFRVVEASEYIIIVLTPGFILDSWNRYTQQATFKELLERGNSRRLLPLCFGLNQNLRVPVELTTQAALEFSDDWENDEESWQKLRRVFTEQRSIANFSMYANQRIGYSEEETNQNGGQQAEDNDPPASVHNPIIQQYEFEDVMVDRLSQGGSSADGEQIIYSRIPLTDSEPRVQGQGVVPGRGIEDMLQETSLVHDGEDLVQDGVTWAETDQTVPKTILIRDDEHQVQGLSGTGREREEPLQEKSLVYDGEDQVQDGVTGRETDEAHPETSLVHGGEYKAQDSRGIRFWGGLFIRTAENLFTPDSLSRVPVRK